MGTAVGNRLYAQSGWVSSGSASVGFIGLALLVCFARGPWETGWVGWRGGWGIRRRDLGLKERDVEEGEKTLDNEKGVEKNGITTRTEADTENSREEREENMLSSVPVRPELDDTSSMDKETGRTSEALAKSIESPRLN